MDHEEFKLLREGDVVQSPSGLGFVITGNYGDRKIATRTQLISNAPEWKLISKAERKEPT